MHTVQQTLSCMLCLLLQPRKLRLWHNLELISTSLCCERLVYEHSRTDLEVLMDADGMAGPSLEHALEQYSENSNIHAVESSSSSQESNGSAPILPVPALGFIASNVVPFSSKSSTVVAVGSRPASPSSNSSSSDNASAVRAAAAAYSAAQAAATAAQQQAPDITSSNSNSSVVQAAGSKRNSWNPADLVAAKLSEAASAASAAALQPLASAAGSLYAGSLSLVSSVTSSVTSTVTSSVISSQMSSLGPAADRVVREAIAGITSAEIASSHPNSRDVKAASTSAGTKCPSEWFVCDHGPSNTRYFVIQGSDSLDHWKTNLMFEPVVFEDPEMGIKVHRGAYEAALALYDRFLPLVQELADTDPNARVCFTVSRSSREGKLWGPSPGMASSLVLAGAWSVVHVA